MTNEFIDYKLPIYGGNILICISPEPWMSLKNMGYSTGGRKRKEAQQCLAWVEEIETPQPMVLASGRKVRWIVALKPDCDLNTLAHECYHLTNYLAAWYGLSTDPGEDEAPAYIHGLLIEDFWKVVVESRESNVVSD